MTKPAFTQIARRLPVLAFVAAACGGGVQSNSGDDAGASEIPPSADAGPAVDAQAPDADASPVTDVTATITVTVTDGFGPVAGVLVVFHDADGEILSIAKTGTNGIALSLASGPTPNQVSAVINRQEDPFIMTWVDVVAGDDLHVRGERGSVGAYRALLPASPPTGSGWYTAAVGNCRTNGGQPNFSSVIDISVWSTCTKDASALLATAMTDSSASSILGYAFAKGLPSPVPNTLPQVTLGSWQAPAEVTVSVANEPAAASVATSLVDVVGETAFARPTNPVAPPGTTAAFNVAPGFADERQASAWTGSYRAPGFYVARRGAPLPAITLDLAAAALAPITSVALDRTNTRRPRAAWSVATGSGLSPQVGNHVVIDFAEIDIEGGKAHYWIFALPPGARALRAPVMPPEANTVAPLGTLLTSIYGATADLVDASWMTDATTFRRIGALTLPAIWTRSLGVPLLPSGASLRFWSRRAP